MRPQHRVCLLFLRIIPWLDVRGGYRVSRFAKRLDRDAAMKRTLMLIENILSND
jgi:hypothetical protein